MNSWWKNNIRLLFLVYVILLSTSIIFKPVVSSTSETTANVLGSSPTPTAKTKAVDGKITPIKSPSGATPSPVSTSSQIQTQTPTPTAVDLFGQVSSHNSPADCWMVIEGHIYNITPYFGRHPGGDGVLAKYCGADATGGFNTKDSIPAKIHSAAARLLLGGFLIQ
jgi:hypothetical protein